MGFAYAAILVSPFLVGTTIASWAPARQFVALRQRACAVIGWTAFVLVLPAAVLLGGARHVVALALLCPLTALTWWRHTGDSDGGDGDDDPFPFPPGPPEIDWELFMRDLEDYRAGLSSSAR